MWTKINWREWILPCETFFFDRTKAATKVNHINLLLLLLLLLPLLLLLLQQQQHFYNNDNDNYIHTTVTKERKTNKWIAPVFFFQVSFSLIIIIILFIILWIFFSFWFFLLRLYFSVSRSWGCSSNLFPPSSPPSPSGPAPSLCASVCLFGLRVGCNEEENPV